MCNVCVYVKTYFFCCIYSEFAFMLMKNADSANGSLKSLLTRVNSRENA